jgi:hypothetical protein
LALKELASPLLAMSGKQTIISFPAFEKIAWAVCGLLGGGGIFYGKRQRHLRSVSVKELSDQLRMLQGLVDYDKGSSGIDARS